jgi:HAE1 family hydrophobic/amphiphilic exporter-1
MKLDRFINRPVLSTVISIVIVILGVLGLLSLPISQYPDIAPPTVRVNTTYQGANAQTVLNSVIAPLEEQINGVENMMYMTSTATNTGEASIEVYFKQGTDPDMAGCRKRTEPCSQSTGSVAGRSNQGRCDYLKTTNQYVAGILPV